MLAIYFIMWWLVFFAVLPWGIRSQHEHGDIVPGTDPGAPAVHGLKVKAGVDHGGGDDRVRRRSTGPMSPRRSRSTTSDLWGLSSRRCGDVAVRQPLARSGMRWQD